MEITTVPTGSNQPAKSPSWFQKNKRWLMIVGVVVLIGLIVWVVWYIVANNEEEPISNNPIVANYQKQLPGLEDAAGNNPDDAKAQTDYAVALYATGDVSAAKEQYEKAVELDPNNATLRNNLGNAYRDLGDYEKAVESYQKAISIDPKSTNAYMNLANLYLYTLDQSDLAIKTYEEALRNIPNNQEIEILLGIAYEQADNKDQAKDTYEKVLAQNPNNAAAQAGLKRVE